MTATAHRAKYWLCCKKSIIGFLQLCKCHLSTGPQSWLQPVCRPHPVEVQWQQMWQAYFFYLMFFCAQPFIAHRLAAKQAVQACCKASSTGLLQSKQYRFAAKQAVQVCCKASSTGLLQSNWVCCKAIKQFPAEQAKVCCWKLASLSEAVCEEWSALCELLRGTSLVNWLCHFLDQVFRALSLTLWEHTLMEFVNLTLGV